MMSFWGLCEEKKRSDWESVDEGIKGSLSDFRVDFSSELLVEEFSGLGSPLLVGICPIPSSSSSPKSLIVVSL